MVNIKRARTNYRRVGVAMKYGQACVTADASGVTSVSSGINSPRFGIAMPRTTSSRNLRAIHGYYYTSSGSSLMFQWMSVSGQVVLNGCVIAFNWVAFE